MSKDFMGGGTFFSDPKKEGHVFFFQSLILNVFFKKVCSIRNQSASCTTEPLFVLSFKYGLAKRSCLTHI